MLNSYRNFHYRFQDRSK